jgi:hypothetical protein
MFCGSLHPYPKIKLSHANGSVGIHQIIQYIHRKRTTSIIVTFILPDFKIYAPDNSQNLHKFCTARDIDKPAPLAADSPLISLLVLVFQAAQSCQDYKDKTSTGPRDSSTGETTIPPHLSGSFLDLLA